MNRKSLLLTFFIYVVGVASAQSQEQSQLHLITEAQMTASSGDNTPLWLNANKYGLSSLKTTNGYVRIAGFRPLELDSARRWAWGAGVDVAVAGGFTSKLIVQQAYGELRFMKGLLTVGSKEQPLQLKNAALSTGSQTLGINARPTPGVRIELPDYWEVPYTKGWLALKGHIFYGMQTDDAWQKDFAAPGQKYAERTKIHTKAGYLRIGRSDRPLSVELGLEMGCQFGGKAFLGYEDGKPVIVENQGGLKSLIHAFVPGSGEATEANTVYQNADGNHVGSWLARVNYDQERWGVSVYADHFFEDQSSMFLLDYDGYGTGDEWNVKKDNRYFLYDLRDMMLGVEVRLKDFRWINTIVGEYLYTKYQSGPMYHDHTPTRPDHVSGTDEYYNHHIFTGWQHWGQVMGNPLYRSPLYNNDGSIHIDNNRFWAWHLGISGQPLEALNYRLLMTIQRGWGSYKKPLLDPQRNFSFLAEATYNPLSNSRLYGWSLRGAVAFDRGGLLGDNVGVQLTVARHFNFF